MADQNKKMSHMHFQRRISLSLAILGPVGSETEDSQQCYNAEQSGSYQKLLAKLLNIITVLPVNPVAINPLFGADF